jgi:hypothetical protein
MLAVLLDRHGLSPDGWSDHFPLTVLVVKRGWRRSVPRPIDVALVLGWSWGLRVWARVSPAIRRFLTVARNSWELFDAIAEREGVNLVVDSSKDPVRLKLLYIHAPCRFKVIHLVRDGRAVAASAHRRTGMPIAAAARDWVRSNRNIELVLRTIPKAQQLRVRYEDLCDDPARELERICRFAGVPYDHGMLTLRQRPSHEIPGNPMLFRTGERSIAKDERWRQELSPEEVRECERVLGRRNRRYGYE